MDTRHAPRKLFKPGIDLSQQNPDDHVFMDTSEEHQAMNASQLCKAVRNELEKLAKEEEQRAERETQRFEQLFE